MQIWEEHIPVNHYSHYIVMKVSIPLQCTYQCPLYKLAITPNIYRMTLKDYFELSNAVLIQYLQLTTFTPNSQHLQLKMLFIYHQPCPTLMAYLAQGKFDLIPFFSQVCLWHFMKGKLYLKCVYKYMYKYFLAMHSAAILLTWTTC